MSSGFAYEEVEEWPGARIWFEVGREKEDRALTYYISIERLGVPQQEIGEHACKALRLNALKAEDYLQKLAERIGAVYVKDARIRCS